MKHVDEATKMIFGSALFDHGADDLLAERIGLSQVDCDDAIEVLDGDAQEWLPGGRPRIVDQHVHVTERFQGRADDAIDFRQAGQVRRKSKHLPLGLLGDCPSRLFKLPCETVDQNKCPAPAL